MEIVRGLLWGASAVFGFNFLEGVYNVFGKLF